MIQLPRFPYLATSNSPLPSRHPKYSTSMYVVLYVQHRPLSRRSLTVPNTPAFDSPPVAFLSPAPPAAAVAELATAAHAAAAAPADPRVVKNSRRVTPPAPVKISLLSPAVRGGTGCSSSWCPLVHWCWCWCWWPLVRDRTEWHARGCLSLLLLGVVVGILGDGLVGR